MNWLIEHYDAVILAVTATLTAASLIAKLTPTPKDDEVIAKIIAYVSFLPPKGKGALKLPFTKVK